MNLSKVTKNELLIFLDNLINIALKETPDSFYFNKKVKLIYLLCKENILFRKFLLDKNSFGDIHSFSKVYIDNKLYKKLDFILYKLLLENVEFFRYNDLKFKSYLKPFYNIKYLYLLFDKINTEDFFFLKDENNNIVSIIKKNNLSSDSNIDNIQHYIVNFLDYEHSNGSSLYLNKEDFPLILIKDLINFILYKIKYGEVDFPKTIVNELYEKLFEDSKYYALTASNSITSLSYLKITKNKYSLKNINKKNFLYIFKLFLSSEEFYDFQSFLENHNILTTNIPYFFKNELFQFFDFLKSFICKNGYSDSIYSSNIFLEYFQPDEYLQLKIFSKTAKTNNIQLYNLSLHFKQKRTNLEIKKYITELNLVFNFFFNKFKYSKKDMDNLIILFRTLYDTHPQTLMQILDFIKKISIQQSLDIPNSFFEYNLFISTFKNVVKISIKHKDLNTSVSIIDFFLNNLETTDDCLKFSNILKKAILLNFQGVFSYENLELYYKNLIKRKSSNLDFQFQQIILNNIYLFLEYSLYNQNNNTEDFFNKFLYVLKTYNGLGISKKRLVVFLNKFFDFRKTDYNIHNKISDFIILFYPFYKKMSNTHKKTNNSLFIIFNSYQSDNFNNLNNIFSFFKYNLKYLYKYKDSSYKSLTKINSIISKEISISLEKEYNYIKKYIDIPDFDFEVIKNMYNLDSFLSSIKKSINENISFKNKINYQPLYNDYNTHKVYITPYNRPIGINGSNVKGVCISQDSSARLSHFQPDFYNLVVINNFNDIIVLWGLLCPVIDSENNVSYVLNNLQGSINDKKIDTLEVLNNIEETLINWKKNNNFKYIFSNNNLFNTLRLFQNTHSTSMNKLNLNFKIKDIRLDFSETSNLNFV